MLVNLVFAFAGAAGLLCVVLVIVATLFHVTLIMFSTGSMAPTIPAGSVAVVRQIPASDVRVGDVVTVDRPGELPVTHRVTSISGSGSDRTITLRGDGNAQDDPHPYLVSTVRLTLFSIPGLAPIIVAWGNPILLGGLTVGVASLVTWAFWPRRKTEPQHRAGSLLVVVVCAGAVALVGQPQGASAAVTDEVISGSHVQLTSIRDAAAMQSMYAGTPVTWEVGVQATTQEPGSIAVSVRSEAPSTGTFYREVKACDVRWQSGLCLAGEQLVQSAAPVEDDRAPLGVLDVSQQRWFLFTVWFDTDPRSRVTLTVQADGWGESVSTAGTTSLASTGLVSVATVGIAAGIFVLGLAVFLMAVRRRLEP